MYCVKCKRSFEPEHPKNTTFNNRGNKMKALKAECPKCGTKCFQIVGKA